MGISNGNETFTQLAFNYLGRANLENVGPVQFLPGEGFSSIPEVTIARPDAGQSFQGVMNGRAIITDAESFVTRADVYVDGVFRALAVRQGARPPECAAVRTDCAEFLFNLNLDGMEIGPGRHTLKLRAVNWRGGFRDGPATPVEFNVEPGQALLPKAVIEQPAIGATVSGLIRVRGYAYAERLRVTAVEVLVDGLTVVRGPLMPRPEICATLSPVPPNCPAIGFDLPVNTAGAFPPIQDGKRLLQVRVIDESGRMTLLPETPLEINVNNGANQPPTGVLVTPANNQRISGMTNIWGYAWDPDGRIVQAQLLVNGEVRAVIPYGEPRTGECPALPAVTACPNIGFALDFDTRKLLNGQQVLGVRVIDNRGAATVLPSPSPNTGGVTVFVEN